MERRSEHRRKAVSVLQRKIPSPDRSLGISSNAISRAALDRRSKLLFLEASFLTATGVRTKWRPNGWKETGPRLR